MLRSTSLLAVGLSAALVGGCLGGDDAAKAPPGSAENPLVALPNPSPTRVPPTPDPDDPRAAAEGDAATRPAAKPKSLAARQRAVQRAAERKRAKRAAERRRSNGTTAERRKSSASKVARGPRKQPAATPVSASKPCTLVTASQARALMGGPVAAPQHALQGPTCIYRARSGKRQVTLTVQRTSFARIKRELGKTTPIRVAGKSGHCGRLGQPMLWISLDKRRVLTIGAPCTLARGFAARALARL